MRIKLIRLTNYRCHADLEVNFQPGFNVIVGVNGSGKTSLLKAICDALSGFSYYIETSRATYNALHEDGVVRLKGEVIQERYRFEPQYPVKVEAAAEAFGFNDSLLWTVKRASQLESASLVGNSPGRIWKKSLAASQDGEIGLDLPLIAFYRANRHWNQSRPREMQAATERNARTDGYASWWDASSDSSALQSWVIGKCLERFQTSSETGTPFDEIQSDELALVNQALASAVEAMKGLKYDLKQKSS